MFRILTVFRGGGAFGRGRGMDDVDGVVDATSSVLVGSLEGGETGGVSFCIVGEWLIFEIIFVLRTTVNVL